MIKNIVLIGAGNVATHFGIALKRAGIELLQVYSKTRTSASTLSGKLNCAYTSDIKELYGGADLYLISVADYAISEVIKMFPFDNVLVAHTSGSTDINVLSKKNIRPAVFYPLQTFTKDVDVSFDEVPLFLEAGNEDDLKELQTLANSISSEVYCANSQQRMILHIAAVFACNFTNYMFCIAEDLLKQHHIDFNLLKPLIRETIRKVELVGAEKAQTGPAIRNDKYILKLHSEMLSPFVNYQEFYNFISGNIISRYVR